jgi:hypothetical protein
MAALNSGHFFYIEMKKILFVTGCLIVAFIFSFSAFLKLYPVEIFELTLVETGFLGWNIAPYAARILIGTELMLAIFLVLNISPKATLAVVLSVLCIFTIYIVFLIAFQPQIKDCGCMGLFMKFSPWESLFKNIFLIMLCMLLYKYQVVFYEKGKKLLGVSTVLLSVAFPFILNPLSNNTEYVVPAKNATGYKLNLSDIQVNDMNGKRIDLSSGKKIVCFFSMHCKFCQLAAKKISVIQQKSQKKLTVYYVFFGEKEDLENFWEEAETIKVPYAIIPVLDFFKLSGKSLPSIYFLNDGIVIKKTGFIDLDPFEAQQFAE